MDQPSVTYSINDTDNSSSYRKRRIQRQLRSNTFRLNPIIRQIRQLPTQNINNINSFENQFFNGAIPTIRAL
ncbi:hypothetical protein GLOIN_2v1762749 [Rhizophagus irregularis DAOM 181602=DAOM 197198]|uniref:Uncharacterized protein n=1 Tax=Rhizophagus irregularis (strain DAOM 181602 / DAOM 197198 / MUCL 43194) TaxID=747089 RepID=U9T9Q4_RHIID|nr:hypothetical protein GLOIN_2v1762749 [Rhizophagus irregularis DAOM 181602=DAOM 197198]POG81863.1 hypothetical protein GLOIN_2v1762749 [Rhizophagus irregularis DAOM 181602=DAOM 197198]|eukprot:XP_025188729.1 hypothetical protein GLOIN_2v1762749 [Rhizophagus irregularis DAOM 181602=DAOM 197198]